MKLITLSCAAISLCLSCFAQNYQSQPVFDSVTAIENNRSLTSLQKLSLYYKWKKKWEFLKLPKDSVFAGILHKIGLFEFSVNKNYNAAILYTTESININISGRKDCSKGLAIKSLYNLGFYFDKITLFRKALVCYDSVISFAYNLRDTGNFIPDARLNKSYIFFRTGDYQKSIEESTMGLNEAAVKKEPSYIPKFLNQRAQALFFQNQLTQSLTDVNLTLLLADHKNQPYQLASAYKMKGYIYAKKRDFFYAQSLFMKAIHQRILTNDYGQIAGDYNDIGNFYRDSLDDYIKARKFYFEAIAFALKDHDSVRLCRIHVNLGEISIILRDFENASLCYIKAFKYLKANVGDKILLNPPVAKLDLIGNKELVLVLLQKKTQLLLLLFKKTNNKNYLLGSLSTALLTDSVITQVRNEQLAEQSKLYWRNRTRDFFNNAIEDCYLSKRFDLAFFFMEKSKAVLLNDKLNELGASGKLPSKEEAEEQQLRMNIVDEEQKMALLTDSSESYKNQQVRLYKAKEGFEQYIKRLEEKYPAYYQYKYADKVNTVKELQAYVTINQQSFVDYFMGDTVTYMLTVTPGAVKMIRLSKTELPYQQISNFLSFCSDNQKLNNNYDSFAAVSNSLYKTLFEPLHLLKGRVVVCPDNFLIPFDAISTDLEGKNFLLYNYSFSYVYSARYLLKKFVSHPSKGNFIGFAPISYNHVLNVPDLKQSGVSLQESAVFYDNPILFTNAKATKQNFIKFMPAYTVVNIFSHATADTTDTQPRLYMQDSIVYLSELQLLNGLSTKLIILSACETNVGKKATGEGVYSLARGFAAAGIPSVAATMWKADESSIYSISEKFHEYLSKGMHKDDALQKAKLFFIQKNGLEKSLPFYWANIILTGNSEPVTLSSGLNRSCQSMQ